MNRVCPQNQSSLKRGRQTFRKLRFDSRHSVFNRVPAVCIQIHLAKETGTADKYLHVANTSFPELSDLSLQIGCFES